MDIDLIVRGACTLRPGLPGVSERIRVRSIVGRFLEHSRVYWFANDGEAELYCSSADWMERNLMRRIEVAFPILDAELASRVFDEALANCLATIPRPGCWTRRPLRAGLARRRNRLTPPSKACWNATPTISPCPPAVAHAKIARLSPWNMA